MDQTYPHLEIILVDDGSPDRCPEICDQYREMDSRVRVIHKENGGLSDARNAGMKLCTGEYLMFVDSDDWMPGYAVQHMVSLALSYHADLIIGEHQRVFSTKDTIIESYSSPAEHVWTKKEAMKHSFTDGCAAWARLYRKEIHEGIDFPVGQINEDEAIVLDILERCSTVVKTDTVIYCYLCRAESITTSDFSPKKLDWIVHCENNLHWIRERVPELEEAALRRLCGSLLWAMREMALDTKAHPTEVKEVKMTIRRYYKEISQIKVDYASKLRLIFGRYVPFQAYRILERMKAKRIHSR